MGSKPGKQSSGAQDPKQVFLRSMIHENDSNGTKYTFTVFLYGQPKCGATSLLLRFCDSAYSETHIPSIYADFKDKIVDFEGTPIRIRLEDTPVSFEFRSREVPAFYPAHAILYVFDMSDPESVSKFDTTIEKPQRYGLRSFCQRCIVAAKSDAATSDDVRQSLEQCAKAAGLPFFVTSAKTDEGVAAPFEAMLRSLIQMQQQT